MNTKAIFGTIGTWVSGLVELTAGLVALGVMTEILFGTGFFGSSVIHNLTSLVSTVGSSGFAGVVALLLLVAMFNRKYPAS
tara:strand:- start:6672 stop:6914 length:243 start_codon:yes stop_codon:yes gene_type:complete